MTIKRTGDGWGIEDHGSSNGTILNGRRLEREGKRALVDGDRLVLGDVVILRPFFTPAGLYARLRSEDHPA